MSEAYQKQNLETYDLEYEQYLTDCKNHSIKIKDLVNKMYNNRINSGLTPRDAADTVKRDLVALGWNSTYIIDCLPQEAKDPEKVKAGKVSAEVRKETVLIGGMIAPNETKDNTFIPFTQTVAQAEYTFQVGKVANKACYHCGKINVIRLNKEGKLELGII